MTTRPPRRFWLAVLLGLILIGLAVVPVSRGIRHLNWTRGALRTYARIVASANLGDLATVRSLCSEHFLAAHPLEAAENGGVVGFPRQIHPNYQVWVEGPEVWLCPSNRVGLVYRFRLEADTWKYDGPVGLMRSRGEIIPAIAGQSNREKP